MNSDEQAIKRIPMIDREPIVYKPTHTFPSPWRIITNSSDERVTVIARNEYFNKMVGVKNAYPICCIFNFRPKKPRKNSKQHTDFQVMTSKIDNEIFELLRFEKHSLVAAVTTLPKLKQYLLYTKDLPRLKLVLDGFQSRYLRCHFISCYEPDSLWENYNSIIN